MLVKVRGLCGAARSGYGRGVFGGRGGGVALVVGEVCCCCNDVELVSDGALLTDPSDLLDESMLGLNGSLCEYEDC